MVAVIGGSRDVDMNSPRCCVSLNLLPSKACDAVAPMQTISLGLSRAISASSQGRQASISSARGFL